MSDKKDKGYDASMLRFVGNLLAGSMENWRYPFDREAAVQAAVETAILTRNQLRKLQEKEESK
jgi:hypothetical protein